MVISPPCPPKSAPQSENYETPAGGGRPIWLFVLVSMVIRLDPAEDPWPEKIESTTAIEKMFFFHLWDFKVVPKRFLQIRF